MNDEKIMEAIYQGFGKKEDRFREVKNFLFRVKDCKRRIDLIEARIEYRMDSMGAHGVSYGEYIPSTHNYSGSAVENAIIALTELEDERQAAEQAYADAKVSVSDLIAKLDDVNQQTVITGKYIIGQSWEKIALDMGMTVRKVQRLHGRALPLLQEMLEGDQAA